MKSKAPDPLFDRQGRRIPFRGMRVFNAVSLRYYRLQQPNFEFDSVQHRISEHAKIAESISPKTFESACADLMQTAKSNTALENIFSGVHVPFFCPPTISDDADLGREFEEHWLPAVENSFARAFPQYHFKKTIQGDAQLAASLRVAENSRYEHFQEARRKGIVVGWYFPSALQEYDIASQRSQMDSLPLPENLVLSGGFDAAAALAGSPALLVNDETYPPLLCLSAFQHQDERLMLCFKAYGRSLEFWCMSQMLTPTITQVSEQWAGGLTLFTVVN
jgi:hypothetical protein